MHTNKRVYTEQGLGTVQYQETFIQDRKKVYTGRWGIKLDVNPGCYPIAYYHLHEIKSINDLETYAISSGVGFKSVGVYKVNEYMLKLGARYYYDEKEGGFTFCRYYFITYQFEIGNYIIDMESGSIHPSPRLWGIDRQLKKLFTTS